MSGARVVARGWAWRYATRTATLPRDITLDIAPGEVVLLAGPSGCGKSTFLAALAGVLGDDQGGSEGSLSVEGITPSAGPGVAGLVLQDPESQAVRETVGDDVAFGCESLGVPRAQIWARVTEALDAVGLDVPLTHPTHRLSGGQKQRLAIAGVLAMGPRIVVLDEPTANLDPDGARAVVAAMSDVHRKTGCTVIVVDHNSHFWADLVQRTITLNRAGTVVSDEPRGPQSARHPRVMTRSSGRDPETMPALSTSDLVVARRGGVGIPVPDVALIPGSLLALTGPNGSGKTSLALTLGGLVAPVSGRMDVSRHLSDAVKPRIAQRPWLWSSRTLARRIGNVFQSPESQFVATTVAGEMRVATRLVDNAARENPTAIGDVLGQLRLDHLADAHPFTLSGGEQRRLSLAAVVMSRPQVLIADEPTFGQDQETWGDVVSMMHDAAREGAAVFIATHDEDLASTADAIVHLGSRSGAELRHGS